MTLQLGTSGTATVTGRGDLRSGQMHFLSENEHGTAREHRPGTADSIPTTLCEPAQSDWT